MIKKLARDYTRTIKGNGKIIWTSQAVKYLFENCYDQSYSQLGETLGVGPEVVAKKIKEIGAFDEGKSPRANPDYIPFTPEEDEYIRTHFFASCNTEISKHLNKTVDQIRHRARFLGLKRTKKQRKELMATPGYWPDRRVAKTITRNKTEQADLLEHPEIINLKRMHLILTANLKNL